MNSETIVYCVVSFLIGMLLAHMLKDVCGCNKVVEGSDEGSDKGSPNKNLLNQICPYCVIRKRGNNDIVGRGKGESKMDCLFPDNLSPGEYNECVKDPDETTYGDVDTKMPCQRLSDKGSECYVRGCPIPEGYDIKLKDKLMEKCPFCTVYDSSDNYVSHKINVSKKECLFPDSLGEGHYQACRSKLDGPNDIRTTKDLCFRLY